MSNSHNDNTTSAIAALQRQMADMARQLQEERTQRLAAEDQLRAAQRPAETTPAAPLQAKMSKPDKFDGTKGDKAEAYFTQMAVYIQANPQLFPTEYSKVTFALSYLTGYASIWAHPFTEAILNGREVSFLDFANQLKAMFFDTERKQNCQKQIRELRQTGHVDQYTQTFLRLSRETKWGEDTLVDLYRQGLKREIRVALLTSGGGAGTLQELTAQALRIGAEYDGISRVTTSKATVSQDPNAMDLSAVRGHLSEPEKLKMMRAGQCFRCSRQGHRAKECPEKGKMGAKSNTRISVVEEVMERIAAESRKASSSKNGGARD